MSVSIARSIEAGLNTLPETESGPKKSNQNFFEKTKLILTNITIEPVFFLYILPFSMASLAVQNLNLEKACRVNLKLNDSICDGLAARNESMYNETDEIFVQKYVASMYAWKNVVQSLIPAVLLLFFGSWSDRTHRRKPFIIIPILGDIVACVGFLICTYFFYELPMEYCILSEALPPAITGGWFAMYMGVYSYITEISTTETRTVRIGAITTINNVSWTVGVALSGVLYLAIGFYGVFTLALCMEIIGLLYGYIRIKEVNSDVPESNQNEKTVGFFRDFFDIAHIKETFKLAFTKGPKNKRKKILMNMILVMIIVGPQHGEATVAYLFVRYRFQWNEIDYSIFGTYIAVAYTLGTIFSLSFFSKYLKLDDALLGALASTSKIISGILYTFAPNSTVFYIGPLIEMFNGPSFIVMRSIISKLVPSEELGKMNSLFGVCEAVMPLAYGPMYTLLYKWTIDVLPGAFFLFGSFLTLPSVIIFLWLYYENKRDVLEERKVEEKEKENLLKPKVSYSV